MGLLNSDEKSRYAGFHRNLREHMVEEQIVDRGVTNVQVLRTMRQVPRHLFVPTAYLHQAYEDRPLPIGNDQTISQPYIVALMTELARVNPQSVVLEIGTGSGYQAAVLSLLAKRVFTLEYIESLGTSVAQRLRELNYLNVEVGIGNGYFGWPEHQPFDAILATAAIDHFPQDLLDQLKPRGRLIIPLDEATNSQMLVVAEKGPSGEISQSQIIPVRFVPFVGARILPD